ncbi:transposase [Lichenicoccus roseus]|uniref:Transposase n=1 Tax=Lichenicoccus roseus TaxID=2683649 RepID=A0A5R9J8M1_9PROT|nr:transposase [Lichenicoccus roseus]
MHRRPPGRATPSLTGSSAEYRRDLAPPVPNTCSGLTSCRASPRQRRHQGTPLRRWRRGGRQIQAIGINRRCRTAKTHALTDGCDRLIAVRLTAGHAADCRAAESLLQELPRNALPMADRASDINAIRQPIEQQGAAPTNPPKRTRCWESCFSRMRCRRCDGTRGWRVS